MTEFAFWSASIEEANEMGARVQPAVLLERAREEFK
jgi:hypothetical protein